MNLALLVSVIGGFVGLILILSYIANRPAQQELTDLKKKGCPNCANHRRIQHDKFGVIVNVPKAVHKEWEDHRKLKWTDLPPTEPYYYKKGKKGKKFYWPSTDLSAPFYNYCSSCHEIISRKR